MKSILLALLLSLSSLAHAETRSLTTLGRYVWTIYDTPCSSVVNPDLLPLKDARVLDLETQKYLDGCALEENDTIEFQIYKNPKEVIHQKYFSKDFKVEVSI